VVGVVEWISVRAHVACVAGANGVAKHADHLFDLCGLPTWYVEVPVREGPAETADLDDVGTLSTDANECCAVPAHEQRDPPGRELETCIDEPHMPRSS
jgi:hypothetical protein